MLKFDFTAWFKYFIVIFIVILAFTFILSVKVYIIQTKIEEIERKDRARGYTICKLYEHVDKIEKIPFVDGIMCD